MGEKGTGIISPLDLGKQLHGEEAIFTVHSHTPPHTHIHKQTQSAATEANRPEQPAASIWSKSLQSYITDITE